MAREAEKRRQQIAKFEKLAATHKTAISAEAWRGFTAHGRGAVLLYADSPSAPPTFGYAPLSKLLSGASSSLILLLQEYCPRSQSVAWIHLKGHGNAYICTREIAPELFERELVKT